MIKNVQLRICLNDSDLELLVPNDTTKRKFCIDCFYIFSP